MILSGPMPRQALRFSARGDPLDASAAWRSIGVFAALERMKTKRS
jgi:hypothetical protein